MGPKSFSLAVQGQEELCHEVHTRFYPNMVVIFPLYKCIHSMKLYILTVGTAMRDHLHSLAGQQDTQWVADPSKPSELRANGSLLFALDANAFMQTVPKVKIQPVPTAGLFRETSRLDTSPGATVSLAS